MTTLNNSFSLCTNHLVLDRDQEQELLLTVHSDTTTQTQKNKARETLVSHNVRLVYNRAARRLKQDTGVQLDDLVSAGMIGLTNAIRKFDITKVNESGRMLRLSTYSVQWIEMEIQREFGLTNTQIKIPTNLYTALTSKVVRKEGADPRTGRWKTLCGDMARDVMNNSRYDTEVKDMEGGYRSIYDGLHADYASPERECEVGQMDESIRNIISKFKNLRERDIVVSRILADVIGVERVSLDSLAEIYGVSRQAINRQEIILKAKLKTMLTGVVDA